MSLNEYTTGAEAYLTTYIDNNFKEKDGLKSEQDQEACLTPRQRCFFTHTKNLLFFSVKE